MEQCISAAGQEFDTDLQQKLLRAARFGMDFLEGSSDSFIEMCQTLRVLSHVRDFKVGIPLSYRQLKALTVQVGA